MHSRDKNVCHLFMLTDCASYSVTGTNVMTLKYDHFFIPFGDMVQRGNQAHDRKFDILTFTHPIQQLLLQSFSNI